MTRYISQYAAVTMFGLLLCLPLLQMHFEFLPEQELLGVVEESSRPEITFSTILDGSWQETFETWFNQRFGFRGHLVKTENQLNYTLFNTLSAEDNVRLVVGKERYLYERGYIDSANGLDVVDPAVLEKKVEDLVFIQEALEQRGITFLVMIAPSKARIYPEFIPDALQSTKDVKTNYDVLAPLLQQYNINHIDGHQYFVDLRNTSERHVFTKGGTHWNYYSACLFATDFIDRLAREREEDYTELVCDNVVVDNTAYGTDIDLANLVNLWQKGEFVGPTPHHRISTKEEITDIKPRIFFVGDSFVWPLLSIMDTRHLYAERTLYYYYSRASVYPDESNAFDFIDKKHLDWEGEVLSNDVIVVEANEAALGELGFGFIEDLKEYLSTQE